MLYIYGVLVKYNYKYEIMRIRKLSVLMYLLVGLLLLSCSKSSDDESSSVGDRESTELIKSVDLELIEYYDGGSYSENISALFNYDTEGKLLDVSSKVSEDSYKKMMSFNYSDNGKLSSVDGVFGPQLVEDIYGLKLNLYEDDATVLEYDENHNPSKVQMFNVRTVLKDVDGVDVEVEVTENLIAEITYDSHPFFLYNTLKSAGILEIMDNLDVFMSAVPDDVKKLKEFLPYNNIQNIRYERENYGEESDIIEISFKYEYNTNGNPMSAVITYKENEEIDMKCNILFDYLK